LNPHSSGPRQRGTVQQLGFLATIVFVAGMLGCATSGPPMPDPPPTALQWPEPPLEARIQFVQTFATEKHLGRERTRGEQFRQLLTGERPPSSHIYQPMDVAVSDDGQRIYVSDFGQLDVFVFDMDSQSVEQIGRDRPFAGPFGLAIDGDGYVYVSEQSARRVVVLDHDHRPVRVIAHPSLVRPADIAIDRERGLLYVADPAHKVTEQHTVKVFTLEGEYVGEIGSGKGQCEGCLFFPTYVEVDPAGDVYVTSTLNARVDVFAPSGEYLRTIGQRGNAFGMFDKPKGIALDSFGNTYIVDSGWSTVQIFNDQGEVLLYFGGRGVFPGLLRNPTGIAIGRDNRIYIADYLNYRVNVYELVNTTAEDSHPSLSDQGLAADGTARALDPANQSRAASGPNDRSAAVP